MSYVLSGVLPLYIVSEYPKSGGSWFSQMLSEYLEVPFPRNKRPMLESCVMQCHYLYSPRFKNAFCVIRDGRDVMVSAYYFMLFHNEKNAHWAVDQMRNLMPFDDYDDIFENLPYFIEYMFTVDAKKTFHFNWSQFVYSWMGNDVPIVRYEDLLMDAPATIARALKHGFGVESDMSRLHQIAKKYSFKNLSGRTPGEENTNSFLRKGIAGDWKTKFTRRASEVFDRFAGEALIYSGYEEDRNWVFAAHG
jgi:hypothetical protein